MKEYKMNLFNGGESYFNNTYSYLLTIKTNTTHNEIRGDLRCYVYQSASKQILRLPKIPKLDRNQRIKTLATES
jgi:hypothetical protein